MLPRVSCRQPNVWLTFTAFAVAILVPWSAARAATLEISGASPHVAAGEQYAAAVYLDTGNDNINAITGALLIPAEFAVQAIRYGDSIIDFWVKAPTMVTGTIPDGTTKIMFSGVMSGGVSVNRGLLFSVLLVASGAASGKIASLSFEKVAILKSDGRGTPATVVLKSLTVTIAPPPTTPADVSITPIFTPDTTAPEQFIPAVARNKVLFDNQYFLVFLARDNDSGIDHYEVQESANPTPGSLWLPAVSPYLLRDQTLRSYIFVQAFDQAGNIRQAVVLPLGHSTSSYQKYLFWCILGVVVLVLFILFIKRKRRSPPVLSTPIS